MIRTIRLLASAAVLVAVSTPLARAGTAVFELFTSQGCSSCPPADALAAEFARRPDFVVVSLPVDYWDYIGWKDTFASPAFTARQKAYAAAHGETGVYTPEVVVDGVAGVVGSDREALLRAADAASGKRGAMSVSLAAHRTGGAVTIEAGAASAGGPREATLWALRVAPMERVAIGRGENKGRTLTYVNVARRIDPVGRWSGAPARYQLNAGAETVVFLLQTGSPGAPGVILGAVTAQAEKSGG